MILRRVQGSIVRVLLIDGHSWELVQLSPLAVLACIGCQVERQLEVGRGQMNALQQPIADVIKRVLLRFRGLVIIA